MPDEGEPRTPLEIAQQLDAWGFNVLPASYETKKPLLTSWDRWMRERTTDMLGVWYRSNRPMNYYGAMGGLTRIVCLDCDNEYTVAWWRNRLGDVLDRTVSSKTRKGYHFFFRIPEGMEVPQWAVHPPEDLKDDPNQLSFDVKSTGGGVILPPSRHEDGVTDYCWVNDPGVAIFESLPEDLWTKRDVRGDGDASTPLEEAAPSRLTDLLHNPPGEGGRNTWLTQVAGHYARQYRGMPDVYQLHVELAAEMLAPALPPEEIRKTIISIWETEQRQEARQVEAGEKASPANGFLLRGDRAILTWANVGSVKEPEWALRPWSNFDIRAVGVTSSGDRRTYDVEMYLSDRQGMIQAALPAKALGTPQALNSWLAGYGAFIDPPMKQQHQGGACSRLGLYLEAQNPPVSIGLPCLGWFEGLGFVTHEGVITKEGLRPLTGYVPDPILRERAPYRYGFDGTREEAQAVLRRVLTHHDLTVAAVMGAWWASCFAKAGFMKLAAHFPFIAAEAPSGSGKTNGMIPQLLQLAGNQAGPGEYTVPELRDRAAAHRNGPLWIDDMSHPEPVMDLLRQATSEGSRSKKGQDRYSSETVQLVAPCIMSGEGLGGITTEKALIDRAIIVHVPSPVNRESQITPGRPQWDDIQDLNNEYGDDLTVLAGWMVQMALEAQELFLPMFRELRPYAGRSGDNLAILRVGGRFLAYMTGDDSWIGLIDAWVEGQIESPVANDNALFTEVLPTVLSHTNWPGRPFPGERKGDPPTAVFVSGGDGIEPIVHFHVKYTASEFRHIRGAAYLTERVHSSNALDSQRQAAGIVGPDQRKKYTLDHASNLKTWYWACSPEISRVILERSGWALDPPVDQQLALPSSTEDGPSGPTGPVRRRRGPGGS